MGRADRRRSPWFAAGVVLLLVAALVVRLLYIDATPAYELRHDARDYDTHARSLALYNQFSVTRAHGRPTAFRPPGFPVFLAGVYRATDAGEAATSRRIEVTRAAQAVVGTLAVGLIGLLAFQLAGRAAALIALGLGAVYVPLITVGGSVMSEPLFLVFMLAALAAALQGRRSGNRYRYAALAGLLAGLAVLTRANALVLLLPLGIALWDSRRRLSPAALGPPALLTVVALLTVAPWTARNAVVLDAFVPVSTQLGSALAGTYNDMARNDDENPASWRHIRHVPAFEGLWNSIRDIPEPVLERRLRKRSFEYIAEHPGYVGEVGFWNSVRLLDLAGFDRARATAATIGIDRGWADAGVVCFWLFAVLALAGAFTPAARRVPWFIWAVPALMFLSVVFLVVETPRYRSAIDPFVVLLAALALTSAAGRAHLSTRARSA